MIRSLASVVIGLAFCCPTAAELTVDSLVGAGSVLQQHSVNTIRGAADPGRRVRVSLEPAGLAATTIADDQGRWSVELAIGAGGDLVQEMRIESADRTIVLEDVVVGELWFCSGQSNMVWSVDGSDGADEFRRTADQPMIRMFTVPNSSIERASEDVGGRWVVCSPETVGSFSAVAYHFGRSLRDSLGVPVGLVNSSWGGSRVEAWMRREALAGCGSCGVSWLTKWTTALEELHSDPAPYAGLDVDDSGWIHGHVPGHVNAFGIDDSVDGIFWHRITADLPEGWAGRPLVVSLGMIDDHDVTYLNGEEIGRTNGWENARVYTVPEGLARAGRNVIAVQCIDGAGPGGLHGDPGSFFVHPVGAPELAISLAGPALLKACPEVRDMPPQHRPSHLYNGMIHALRSMPFRGVIWYQGENNAIDSGDPGCYESLLGGMIEDWRSAFAAPELPFFIVQLPNFRHAGSWDYARVRDAQRRVAQADSHVGLAITMDLGEADDIHPRNKHGVGRRLARLALADVYGLDTGTSSGPMPLSARTEGDGVVVAYETFGSSLGTWGGDGPLGGFEVAGPDGTFVAARAALIDGTRVRVDIPERFAGRPVLVRCDWAGEPRDDDPVASRIGNAEGMPASPFELAVTGVAPGAVRDRPDSGDEHEPGVSMRIYSVGRDLDRIIEPMPGTTPNVDELRPNIDWRSDSDFGGLMDHFVVEVTGKLEIDEPGEYEFRLSSDDGSMLTIDGERIIWIRGVHPVVRESATVDLDAGLHPLRILFFENMGGAYLTLEWRPPGMAEFEIVPEDVLRTEANVTRVVAPGFKPMSDGRGVVRPGDGVPLEDLHPSWTIETLHDAETEPMVGCMTFLPDGRLLIGTFEPRNNGVWLDEPNGTLHVISNWDSGVPEEVDHEVFAEGVYHPLGLCVVDGAVYLAQRDEITRFTDADGDGVYEGRETFAEGWTSDNYHHFTFGLKHHQGHLYASLSTSIGSPVELERGSIRGINGPNPAHRGTLMRIDLDDGSVEYLAGGFRTPNGILVDDAGRVFVCDNQGAWMPASRISHARPGGFYGHYNETNAWSEMYPDGGVPSLNADRRPSPPAIWLPQNEAANSPTSLLMIEDGPFAGQMLLGELKMGGIRRVALEEVDGQLQGAVFRHTQGLEGGVNRLEWAPDGSLIVGCIGEQATWSWRGTRSGLQRLVPTGESTFEYHEIKAEPDGFTVRFTRPVDRTLAGDPDRWELDQWGYRPTPEYGGPKIDERRLEIEEARVSADGRTVRLVVAGLETGRVVRLAASIEDEAGRPIHATEAWYTLNRLPGMENRETERDTMLVFSKTAGFRHGSIGHGIKRFRAIGEELGMKVLATEDASVFEDDVLARCEVVVFLNTTGDVLDLGQEAALERYVRGGGGWIGVHAAADTEYDWPFYGDMVGAYFKTHPRIQEAVVVVEDSDHPATRMLPGLWSRTDEWYVYRLSPRPHVRVLASLDEMSYTGGGMNGDHPIAWCHDIDLGRALYTGGGHTNESFDEKLFVEHLRGAVLWASGREAD